ncbi:MAG: thioredoxin domain-containing protein [Rhodospirillales bacterium]
MGRLANLWPLLAVLLAGSGGAAAADIRATDAPGPARCSYAEYQGSSGERPAWPAANCLGGAASPYLRLHEADPVHWRPWGPAALAEAKASGKLIFLSIGYTACHWCHVMQRDNFEDGETARFMNSRFVNVLLDREEHPDVDATYQLAAVTLGVPTGWPLNIVLMPDGKPLFASTYLPPVRRLGMPTFTEFLTVVFEAHREFPEDLARRAAEISAALARASEGQKAEVSRAGFDAATRTLLGSIDSVHGGFDGAAKFPYLPALGALWRAHLRTGGPDFRQAVTRSLENMAQGGLYDHIGGGFARYATDPGWNIPHFEKVLDVNAQMIELMTDVWRETRSPLLAARVRQSVRFLFDDMRLPGGGFAATIDSDSEGREGAFYVWSADEIDAVLGPDSALFKRAYGVTAEGNWQGTNVLTRNTVTAAELAQSAGLDRAAIEARLDAARRRLKARRARRPRPFRNDTVLADWNGLAIAALSEAGAAFGEPEWIGAARRAFAFVDGTLGAQGRLRHSWSAGTAGPEAKLDDYAHMARAGLALFEITGEAGYVERARAWMSAAESLRDEGDGGYFLNAPGGTGAVPRIKVGYDDQMPAGNAVVADVLARLYYLTGDDGYRARAERTIGLFFGAAQEDPVSYGAMLGAADTLLGAVQVVVVGKRGEPATDALLEEVWRTSLPGRAVDVIAPGEALAESHPARGKGQIDGLPTAYVCIGTFCSLPVTGRSGLAASLKEIRALRVAPGAPPIEG